MPERTDQDVLREYEGSLKSMQNLGYGTARVHADVNRNYGEALAEIMRRKLLVEAARVYVQAASDIPVNTTFENIRFPGPLYIKR